MEYEGKCGICDYRALQAAGTGYYYSNGNIMAEDEWCLYNPPGWEDNDVDSLDRKILDLLQNEFLLVYTFS